MPELKFKLQIIYPLFLYFILSIYSCKKRNLLPHIVFPATLALIVQKFEGSFESKTNENNSIGLLRKTTLYILTLLTKG